MNLLVEGGQPLGERWSFDSENRRRLPRKLVAPCIKRPSADTVVNAALADVRTGFGANPGRMEGFAWPVTHAQARDWLQAFLDQRLVAFGDYQDAIGERETFLFHATTSPALNCGLLTPAEVVERTLERAAAGGVALLDANFFGFEHAMRASMYTGGTGIHPVDVVLGRMLEEGWCHHIERLMVLGNFMLLTEIAPDAVDRWFMEMFVDACDWVMVPNVYGMSQFADGGLMCTKPYVSASAYLLRMNDFPKGDWCET